MKKKIIVSSFFLVIILAAVLSSVFLINDGAFKKWSHTTVLKEHFENGEAMYLGYNFSWEGIGRPTLTKVDFIKKDGTLLAQGDDVTIQPYIEMSRDGNMIGALDEETVKNEGWMDQLTPFENVKVDDDFRVVLRVHYDGVQTSDDIHEMKITFKKFGFTRHQTIPFEGILSEEQ